MEKYHVSQKRGGLEVVFSAKNPPPLHGYAATTKKGSSANKRPLGRRSQVSQMGFVKYLKGTRGFLPPFPPLLDATFRNRPQNDRRPVANS